VGLSGFREREEVAVQGALFDHAPAPAGDDKPAM
jgi:hypothetical protein